ncbi:MAG: alpha/beta hydrolase [Clostridia bacterium]|nr:alpha/beta hydrolase [Clostridia bacterium]
MKETLFETSDGTKLVCYLWDDVENPQGVVQIIHGMKEHSLRYAGLAKYLNQNGLIVFADDHRAHGKTAKSPEDLGKYDKETNIYEDTVKDEIEISNVLKAKYSKLPLFVFGHSYGSLIGQKYIEDCNLYKAIILCGTSYMNTLENKMAKTIAKITMLFKGKNAPAKMIEKLSFSSYSKGVPEGEMWISHNKDVCKAYQEDPLCNTPFSAKFYYDLMSGTIPLYKKNKLEKINKTKPIMLIAGEEDKFSKNAKLVEKLKKTYEKYNFDNLSMKIYPKMRHEIHNEIDSTEVYKDIKNFFLDNV